MSMNDAALPIQSQIQHNQPYDVTKVLIYFCASVPHAFRLILVEVKLTRSHAYLCPSHSNTLTRTHFPWPLSTSMTFPHFPGRWPPLCCGYMGSKIISKLFQPSSTSGWNNFARNYFKVISEAYCSSRIFSNMFNVAENDVKKFQQLK